MKAVKKAYADPVFAAEMQAIADARRAREAGRTGHGQVVGEDGLPTARNPEWGHNGDFTRPVQECVSVLRPSGSAR